MSLRLAETHRGSMSRARRQRSSRSRQRLFTLEGLEGRVLLSGNPTYYTVNLTSDTGASSGTNVYPTADTPSGDLLWAITQANANTNAAGSVITFDPTAFATPQTITLSSTLVLSELAGPEVIQGAGENLLTISGGDAVGVLQVDAGAVATLSGLTISGGNAANGGGINNGGTLTVTSSTISNNGANNKGGGIENRGLLTITGSTISNNTANNNGICCFLNDFGYGGGIDNSGTLTLIDSSIAENGFIDNGLGGGINNSGMLTVTGSTIANNGRGCCSFPQNGGGIENSGTLTLTNSTIAGNQTAGSAFGGGVDNFGTLMAVNTTIAFNGAAGLYDEAGGTATLDNTIVALNTYQSGGTYRVAYDDIAGGPVSSASAYNLIGIGGSGGLTNGSNGNLVGVADPRLAAGLASNGGQAQTIALLAGSPAIGAGSNALASEYSLTTDQRGAGFPRIVNGTVDIGAFESPVFGNRTVYTVNLTSDIEAFNGANAMTATSGDLLWAMTQANANTNPAGSVIEFDPAVFNSSSPKAITLTNTLELSEAPWPEVIQGPGASALTISG
ncbi:MAG TPA: right-handed parallel beta-helix repeat-containing protein, partial [Isosphaeraceae bacterium]|nr:right-handed parallel beta-helix repeat-containing protein [Isosphaeraceae bacterium]